MIQQIITVAVKEAKQLRRDPRLLPMLFIAPVLQLILFGYGATFDIKNLPLAVWDQDQTAQSREYLRGFTHSEYFVITDNVQSYTEAIRRMDRGKAQIVLVIPSDFGKSLKRGRPAQVQALVDGSDSNTAQIGLQYINAISGAYAVQVRSGLLRSSKVKPAVDGRLRFWYNPDLRSKNFMVPGVMAVILLVMTSMMTALGIVKEKELGTIEQLNVTPLRPLALMVGKLFPFAVIGLVDITLILLAGVLWFKVPIRGSIPLLFAVSGVYLLSTLGLGLFISTLSKTQNQAQLATFFMMLPLMILSGFFFPIANMPPFFQDLSYLSPVRYYLVMIRGIFLKGNGVGQLWPQIIPLAILGGVIFILSVLRYRREFASGKR